MKTYNQTNFFTHTFCEFTQVDHFEFPTKNHFKSKSNSFYFYAKDGVYRKSNHWGRVANCRWNIIANNNYKNQQEIIGFAKWTDFYPTNSIEKLFWISVDFEQQYVKIKASSTKKGSFLMSLTEAHQKTKTIRKLFLDDKWATYFKEEINLLREKIITEYINSNKTIQEVKKDFK